MRNRNIFLISIGICIVVAGCSSIYESKPIGIGRDPAEMKMSPCACMLVKQKTGLPEWFVSEEKISYNGNGCIS
ncbi:MAG: hypothetical protein KAJ75_07060 [Alphaproteobacteria bacterium]|nr:hypothetical protein [Alphaproteobacteria bacterium]